MRAGAIGEIHAGSRDRGTGDGADDARNPVARRNAEWIERVRAEARLDRIADAVAIRIEHELRGGERAIVDARVQDEAIEELARRRVLRGLRIADAKTFPRRGGIAGGTGVTARRRLHAIHEERRGAAIEGDRDVLPFAEGRRNIGRPKPQAIEARDPLAGIEAEAAARAAVAFVAAVEDGFVVRHVVRGARLDPRGERAHAAIRHTAL